MLKNLKYSLETEVLDMLSPVQTDGLGIGETYIDFLFDDELNNANEVIIYYYFLWSCSICYFYVFHDNLPSNEDHQVKETSRNVKLI